MWPLNRNTIIPCSKDVFLHGAILNAMTRFLYRKEYGKASEVLKDTISNFRYMLHFMSLQKVSVSERVKTFNWHLITIQLRPNAHILDVCILNDLNVCQLYDKFDHVPFNKVSL